MSTTYGLIFDVDGVIADTEAVNARASIEVFAERFALQGVKREDFEDGVGRGAEEYMRAAARVHGLELTDEQVLDASRLRQEKFLAMLAADPLPPFPGVRELMDAAITDADFTVGIATSSDRHKAGAVLKAAKIPVERIAYVNGSDVTHKKPDPELFLRCAQRMAIDPARCVVIEDAPNGIEAARAAGCCCVAVTNSFPSDRLQDANRVVNALTEIDLASLRDLIGDP